MRLTVLGALLLAIVAGVTSCGPRETVEERHREANTVAGKMGQAAHKAALEADKAGRVVSRQLGKAAHDAHEGWNEAGQKDSHKGN